MTEGDLDAVVALERRSFPYPWSREAFQHELSRNAHARSFVVRHERQPVVAYACVWFLADQLMINTVAVAQEHRAKGLGRWLLAEMIQRSVAAGCREALLEVRPSNTAALQVYRRLGFGEQGVRPAYYRNGEDGLLMNKKISVDG
jgi:ribosomal-protein-alanine N-acetyltransferase